MNERPQRRRWFLAAVALAALTLALALTWQWVTRPEVEIPVVNTSEMEPQVAALIERATQQLRKQPESAAAWGRLGQVYHAHDLYQAAFACYQRAYLLAPDSFRWHYLAAEAQRKISPERAIPYFENALALSPEREEIGIALAETLLKLGRYDAAKKVYADTLNRNPESAFALLGLGRLALLNNKVETSVMHLEQARALLPELGEVHGLLAQLYLRQGDDDKARQSEELARIFDTPLRPEDPTLLAMQNLSVSTRAYTDRGARFGEQGDYKAAETQFRKVLELRPGSARDHSNLGATLLSQGRRDEALAEFKKAFALDPVDVDMLSNYGLALLRSGDPGSAASVLAKAVEQDPGYAQAHFNLGVVHEQQQAPDAAIRAYETALKLDPGLADAHLNLGGLYANNKQLERAIESWERFSLLKPGDPAALYNIGQARQLLGQHHQAVQRFEDGLKVAPNSSRFVFALAWELATAPGDNLRDAKRAIELANRLVTARPDEPRFADLLAAALAESGDFEQATRVAERALALAAGNPVFADEIKTRIALYRAGRVFRQPGVPGSEQEKP